MRVQNHEGDYDTLDLPERGTFRDAVRGSYKRTIREMEGIQAAGSVASSEDGLVRAKFAELIRESQDEILDFMKSNPTETSPSVIDWVSRGAPEEELFEPAPITSMAAGGGFMLPRSSHLETIDSFVKSHRGSQDPALSRFGQTAPSFEEAARLVDEESNAVLLQEEEALEAYTDSWWGELGVKIVAGLAAAPQDPFFIGSLPFMTLAGRLVGASIPTTPLVKRVLAQALAGLAVDTPAIGAHIEESIDFRANTDFPLTPQDIGVSTGIAATFSLAFAGIGGLPAPTRNPRARAKITERAQAIDDSHKPRPREDDVPQAEINAKPQEKSETDVDEALNTDMSGRLREAILRVVELRASQLANRPAKNLNIDVVGKGGKSGKGPRLEDEKIELRRGQENKEAGDLLGREIRKPFTADIVGDSALSAEELSNAVQGQTLMIVEGLARVLEGAQPSLKRHARNVYEAGRFKITGKRDTLADKRRIEILNRAAEKDREITLVDSHMANILLAWENPAYHKQLLGLGYSQKYLDRVKAGAKALDEVNKMIQSLYGIKAGFEHYMPQVWNVPKILSDKNRFIDFLLNEGRGNGQNRPLVKRIRLEDGKTISDPVKIRDYLNRYTDQLLGVAPSWERVIDFVMNTGQGNPEGRSLFADIHGKPLVRNLANDDEFAGIRQQFMDLINEWLKKQKNKEPDASALDDLAEFIVGGEKPRMRIINPRTGKVVQIPAVAKTIFSNELNRLFTAQSAGSLLPSGMRHIDMVDMRAQLLTHYQFGRGDLGEVVANKIATELRTWGIIEVVGEKPLRTFDKMLEGAHAGMVRRGVKKEDADEIVERARSHRIFAETLVGENSRVVNERMAQAGDWTTTTLTASTLGMAPVSAVVGDPFTMLHTISSKHSLDGGWGRGLKMLGSSYAFMNGEELRKVRLMNAQAHMMSRTAWRVHSALDNSSWSQPQVLLDVFLRTIGLTWITERHRDVMNYMVLNMLKDKKFSEGMTRYLNEVGIDDAGIKMIHRIGNRQKDGTKVLDLALFDRAPDEATRALGRNIRGFLANQMEYGVPTGSVATRTLQTLGTAPGTGAGLATRQTTLWLSWPFSFMIQNWRKGVRARGLKGKAGFLVGGLALYGMSGLLQSITRDSVSGKLQRWEPFVGFSAEKEDWITLFARSAVRGGFAGVGGDFLQGAYYADKFSDRADELILNMVGQVPVADKVFNPLLFSMQDYLESHGIGWENLVGDNVDVSPVVARRRAWNHLKDGGSGLIPFGNSWAWQGAKTIYDEAEDFWRELVFDFVNGT